jgi:hypothetical protein
MLLECTLQAIGCIVAALAAAGGEPRAAAFFFNRSDPAIINVDKAIRTHKFS